MGKVSKQTTLLRRWGLLQENLVYQLSIGHRKEIPVAMFRVLALRWTKSYRSKRQFWNLFTHQRS